MHTFSEIVELYLSRNTTVKISWLPEVLLFLHAIEALAPGGIDFALCVRFNSTIFPRRRSKTPFTSSMFGVSSTDCTRAPPRFAVIEFVRLLSAFACRGSQARRLLDRGVRPISKPAACSNPRSSYGTGNSGACPFRNAASDAIITPAPRRFGWPARESRAGARHHASPDGHGSHKMDLSAQRPRYAAHRRRRRIDPANRSADFCSVDFY